MILRSQVEDNEVLRVQLANLLKKPTVVKLSRLDGKTLFLDTVRHHNGYLHGLNLRQIQHGTYLLTVEQEDQALQQVVLIKPGMILLSRVTRA